MNALYHVIKPLLSVCEAELAHELTIRLLQFIGRFSGSSQLNSHPIKVAGLTFPNRVGLAAGFDKDGRAIAGLNRLGFGSIEIGGVTPRAQAGNPKPRVFRYPKEMAVINRMGFNSKGIPHLKARLNQTADIYPTILGANLGINKDTPLERAVDDFLHGLTSLLSRVDYFTINLSSPNTPGLRHLQYVDRLDGLLRVLVAERNALLVQSGRAVPVPLFVKVSPDLDVVLLRETVLAAQGVGIDGVIATNTTIDRTGLHHHLANQAGGLSGRPLLRKSLRAVEAIREAVGSTWPIIGVGGITSGEDAQAMRRAGADLIQLYTALIYRGPRLVKELIDATT